MIPGPISDTLALELLEPHHAEELFRVVDANRDYLREWLPWLDRNIRVEDTASFIEAVCRRRENNNGIQTIIRHRGNLVGVIDNHGIDWNNRSTSLGYWLARDAQGQGIMTASCRAFVSHAFHEQGLNRVEIRCATGNARSRAIPERLGFHLDGTLRDAEWLYDHFVDLMVYSMLASEWKP